MKKLIYCLIAVILLIAAILGILYLSSGFSTRTDVDLLNFSYNSAEETLTLNTTLFSSMGFIRKATVKHNGEKIYVSFYNNFGLNNPRSAKNSFDIKVPPKCSEVYFEREGNTYWLVLKKDSSGKWINAKQAK